MHSAVGNPFEALLRYQAPTAPAAVPNAGAAGSKASRARSLLMTAGPLTAAEICRKVDFPNTGLVYAALKRDIAEGRVAFDRSRGGLYRWAGGAQPLDAAVGKGGRPRALTPEQHDQAVALYAAGHSRREIAAILNTHNSSIRRALVRAGAQLRTQSEASSIGNTKRHARRRRTDAAFAALCMTQLAGDSRESVNANQA